jgi:hypothetical protein
MKHTQNLVPICIVFFVFAFAKAQQQPTSSIKTAARYSNGSIELRFFPDRKRTLDIGLQSGFIIERANSKASNYVEIGRTKAFSIQQWQEVLDKAVTEEEKIQLEIAQDFTAASGDKNGGNLDLTEGIGAIRAQKGDEDFQFMVSVLTAIKNTNAAQGMGLSFIDNTVQRGVSYSYRVKLVGNVPVYTIDPVPVDIIAAAQENLYKNEVFTKTGDTELSFVWEDIPELSGVDVERTINGKSIQLNDAPIYALRGKGYKGPKRTAFNEDSLINYQKYTYRFYGRTIFGERLLFAEVVGMPRDLTPPQQAFLKQPQHTKPNEVLVEWEMKAPIAADFKGFAVSRSDKNDGYFSLLHDKLLPKGATKFIDKSFLKGKTNYYLVQAVDTANNISSSFPVAVTLIDSIPPIKPIVLSGKIDSLGIVTIAIKKNPESDLMGYRLYRSNAEEHEFSAIREGFLSLDSLKNPVQTIFKDTVTLKSLTPYIYYKAEALDFNHNTSAKSAILKVKRPDKIAPTTPVFKHRKSTKDGIELTFSQSRSIDVKEQILYRKTDMKEPWVQLINLEKDQTTYIDNAVGKGKTYYYSMRAIDDSNNTSKYAFPVQGKAYDTGMRPPIENLRVKRNENEITLTWNYPTKNENTFFIIYKKNKKGQLVQHDRSLELSFRESGNKNATYAIKVFTTDGRQSKISEEIVVK